MDERTETTKKGIKIITHMFTPTIEVTDEVDRVLDFLAEVACGLLQGWRCRWGPIGAGWSSEPPDYLTITREVVINDH